MTIETFVGDLQTPYLPPLVDYGTLVNLSMNDTAHKFGFLVTAPRTGILTGFEFSVGATSTIAGSSIVRFSFQSLDPVGSWQPDGVISHYRLRSAAAADADTWVFTGLITDDGTDTGVPRSVVQGERFACVIDWDTFVAGDYFELKCLQTPGEATNAPDAVWEYVTSWVENPAVLPTMALVYDTADGGAAYQFTSGCFPIWLTNTVDFQEFGGEHGMQFSVPAPLLISGATVRMASTLTSGMNPIVLRLYDTDGVTVLDTVLMPYVAGVARYFTVRFSQDFPLAANEIYRIALEMGFSGFDYLILVTFEVASAGLMNAVEGGPSFRYTKRDYGSPTWDDNELKRPWMALLIRGLDHQTGVVS